MFDEYYYTDLTETPIYFSIITLNNSVETTLYKGNKLIVRKSLQKGIHILKKKDVELKVKLKWFEATPELRVNGKIVSPQKVKRKELREKLKVLKITNELNPKSNIDDKRNFIYLKTPVILLSIGAIWQVTFNEKGKLWAIPSMIIFFIAFIYLFGSIIDRIPERYLDSETKVKIKFLLGFAGMVSTQMIINKIIHYTS